MSLDVHGAVDIHVHTAPDVVERSADDNALANALASAGFGGAVLKAHREPTAARARLATRPHVTMFGSVVLNENVGGLNAAAVDALAGVGASHAKIVWLPTLDAANDRGRRGLAGGYRLLRHGSLAPELDPVLHAIAAHDMVLASGHIAPSEAVAVFDRARALGVRHMVATHVASSLTPFSQAELARAVGSGAVLEFTALSVFKPGADRTHALSQIVQAIETFGPDRVVLSSDAGKPSIAPSPEALLGLAEAIAAQTDAGTARATIATTPRRLLGMRSAQDRGSNLANTDVQLGSKPIQS